MDLGKKQNLKNFGSNLGELNLNELSDLDELNFTDRMSPIYELLQNLSGNKKLKKKI